MYLINAGDILIIPPNISHSISSHEQGTRFICLFDIEFITMFAKEYGYNIRFEDVEFIISSEPFLAITLTFTV